VIVQVGSALAHRSIPLQSAYCGAKHAIAGFTESIRSELMHEQSRVRITIVHLPGVNTTQFEWTKNRMPHKPRPTGPIFQPEVAADAIVFVSENDRKEIWVGYPTTESVVGEKVASGMLDHYLSHAAWEGALRSETESPRPDNFWHALLGDHGSHGPFDEQAHDASLQLWMGKHRKGLLATVAGIGLGAAAYAAYREHQAH